MEEKKKKQKLYLETMNKMTDEQSDCNVVRYVVSVQAFTSLQIDQSVCAECDCHPMGASQRGCESQTGRCVCAHPSVGGRRCDQCPEMFYGFNPGVGR